MNIIQRGLCSLICSRIGHWWRTFLNRDAHRCRLCGYEETGLQAMYRKGFIEIGELIAEYEKDPAMKRALDKARAEIRVELAKLEPPHKQGKENA